MLYQEFRPDESLRRYVLTYWTFSVSDEVREPQIHRILPDGCLQFAYLGREDRVHFVGPRRNALEVTVVGGDRYWGVRLRPGAAGAFLGQPCLPLREQLGPAHLISPELADTLETALRPCNSIDHAAKALDMALRDRIAHASAPDELVEAGIAAIVASNGRTRIADLAARLGLSERQFRRRFTRDVGLTPKQFARIRRFRASVGRLLADDPQAWAQVAAEMGYADQAHLTHEVRDLYGESPTRLSRSVRGIEHRDVEP